MENSKMFGDLDLYKDPAFFQEHTTGTLMLPTKSYKLEIFACMVASSSEKAIYETHRWQADINGLLDHVSKNALHLHEDTLERLRSDTENPQVLAMSTCSSEFTNARTIILAAMIPYSPGM